MATPARYAFPVGPIRPPSEGGSASLLIQVTRNCHWNRCGFCRLYRGERFELRSPAEVKADIDAIAAICTELRAVSDEMGRGGLSRSRCMGRAGWSLQLDVAPMRAEHNQEARLT